MRGGFVSDGVRDALIAFVLSPTCLRRNSPNARLASDFGKG
jgi:hypothetical protein